MRRTIEIDIGYIVNVADDDEIANEHWRQYKIGEALTYLERALNMRSNYKGDIEEKIEPIQEEIEQNRKDLLRMIHADTIHTDMIHTERK